jgi:hypothetical protein
MPALTTDQVLLEEAIAIHGEAKLKELLGADKIKEIREPKSDQPSRTNDLYQTLNSLNSAALCLSGGGIRSAAFALGVIQALATHPKPIDQNDATQKGQHGGTAKDSLLAKFHYLSTVSGGGYIGGWFSAWLYREPYDQVWAKLIGRGGKPDMEPSQLSWLRNYSNFLTPKLGLASADSWAAVSIVLRNLILNWLVIIPALCVVLIFLKLFASGVAWFSQFDPRDCDPWFKGLLAAGTLFLIWSLRFSTRNRPTRGPSAATQTTFLVFDWLPAVVAGVLFTFAAALTCTEVYVRNHLTSETGSLPLFLDLIRIAVPIYVVAWLLAVPRWRGGRDFFGDLAAWIVAAGMYGALIATGLYLYFADVPDKGFWLLMPKESLLLICGVPWLLMSQLIAELIFVGFTSWEEDSDIDREWLARAAGWFFVTALGWLMAMFLVFVGAQLTRHLYGQLGTWVAAGGTGAVTALLGKSRFSPAKGAAKDGKELSANVVLAVTATLFSVALIIGISALIDQILFGVPLLEEKAFGNPIAINGSLHWPGGWWLVIALVTVSFVGLLASKFVNINRFSLHALYRNRLVRAFLGASNQRTDRNPFTDFAKSDNLSMSELWPTNAGPAPPLASARSWRPLHVINMALNIVSSKKLAWQERKAESFTVSPLHAGTACGGVVYDNAGGSIAYGAFRPSAKYGGDKGISLGTAVAISGAAASPNMGYHSSPPLALLLTLFNVRLGWWLGNTGKKGENTYGYEGPRTAIVPLLSEMFGQTTDDNRYIYLSDGGHFENLGLYEMVRRRCRFILISDAGCDKEFQFDDLGNAVRKISLDLGVSITFRGLTGLKYRADSNVVYSPQQPPFYAVGTIDYPGADGGSSQPGTILYIKPCFHGNRIENVGVRNYAAANADFPHQSTGDQFFSESQFESYRALGFEMTDSVITGALKGSVLPAVQWMEELFKLLVEKTAHAP